MARRDIVSDWRESRLSLLWPLLFPLVYSGLFVFLRPAVQGGEVSVDWSYAVFVLIGFSLWQLWFEGLRMQMEAVKANRSLLSRADLSPVSLFFAGYMLQLFQLSMRLVMVLLVTFFLVRVPSATACLAFVVVSALTILNGCVVGFCLQPFSTLIPDVARTLQSASLALLVSGGVFIVFPPTTDPLLLHILAINPLASLIDAARAPIIGDTPLFLIAPWVWGGLTFLGLAVQVSLSRKVLPVLLERVGS
jgi:lipopolysaccharide transport system permease protein